MQKDPEVMERWRPFHLKEVTETFTEFFKVSVSSGIANVLPWLNRNNNIDFIYSFKYDIFFEYL